MTFNFATFEGGSPFATQPWSRMERWGKLNQSNMKSIVRGLKAEEPSLLRA